MAPPPPPPAATDSGADELNQELVDIATARQKDEDVKGKRQSPHKQGNANGHNSGTSNVNPHASPKSRRPRTPPQEAGPGGRSSSSIKPLAGNKGKQESKYDGDYTAMAFDERAVEVFDKRHSMFRLPLSVWIYPLIIIPSFVLIFFLGGYSIDTGIQSSLQWDAITGLVFDPSLAQAQSTLDDLGKIMSAALALVLTISSFVIQLASNRFTPHITALFFRDKVIANMISFMVIVSIYVIWVNYISGPEYTPQASTFIAIMAVSVSLLLLFPYFAFLFDFLDPHKFVRQIMADGVKEFMYISARRHKHLKDGVLLVRKASTIEAVERLTDIAHNALRQKDTNITSDVTDALQVFCIKYGLSKRELPESWYTIDDWIRRSPDFVSLSAEAVGDLHERHSWFEWKVLRQYQGLFLEAMSTVKDLCYVLAINTRKIGEGAGRRGDFHTLDLTIKFFNTYLRASINAVDIRTAYNVLHQYRQLAESLLKQVHDHNYSPEFTQFLVARISKISRFFRYYALLCSQKPNLAFIADIMSYDLGQMTDYAFHLGADCHIDLLHVFLTINDGQEGQSNVASRALRFSQIKLACTYLLNNAFDLALEIQQELADEPPSKLLSLWNELKNVDQREFWEVNDRGTNFNYLAPEQKIHLPLFFAYFKDLRPLAKGQMVPEILDKLHRSEGRARADSNLPGSGAGDDASASDSHANKHHLHKDSANNAAGMGVGPSGGGGSLAGGSSDPNATGDGLGVAGADSGAGTAGTGGRDTRTPTLSQQPALSAVPNQANQKPKLTPIVQGRQSKGSRVAPDPGTMSGSRPSPRFVVSSDPVQPKQS
eukprot:TRINITY_DN8094_c0_g1_i1.p1 TRINITY_DN8094_c0_g1~~TRINITY_DN8094_c0_g1_i1.p1  ORF type:complete len:827 (-),score=181.53 TRINITY_DN8094_c0_g1_i1:20-2500(-)